MIGQSPLDSDRWVIPRLHPFEVALQSGELQAGVAYAIPETTIQALNHKRAEWEADRSVGLALDLTAFAVAAGQKHMATDAARFLRSKNRFRNTLAKNMVDFVLETDAVGDMVTRYGLSPDESEGQYTTDLKFTPGAALIRRIRASLRLECDDPIGWLTLAFAHALEGRKQKSETCANIARHLAPADRYILRFSARLRSHFGDDESAHKIIRNAAWVKSDPWLLSAEISFCSKIGKCSRLAKLASNRIPIFGSTGGTSELIASLGTLELECGKTKQAKKLFAKALRQPTENSLAQAAHAVFNKKLNLENISETGTNAFEAIAIRLIYSGDWTAALDNIWKWQHLEKCSTRPLHFGGFIALTILRDPRLAIEFSNVGIRANPNDFGLLNNLAVSYALLSDLKLANMYLNRINSASLQPDDKITLLATRGLLEFRKHNLDSGRQLYASAISNAKKSRALPYAEYFHVLEEFNVSAEFPDADNAFAKTMADIERIPEKAISATLASTLASARARAKGFPN